jgi:hypothetical protein
VTEQLSRPLPMSRVVRLLATAALLLAALSAAAFCGDRHEGGVQSTPAAAAVTTLTTLTVAAGLADAASDASIGDDTPGALLGFGCALLLLVAGAAMTRPHLTRALDDVRTALGPVSIVRQAPAHRGLRPALITRT